MSQQTPEPTEPADQTGTDQTDPAGQTGGADQTGSAGQTSPTGDPSQNPVKDPEDWTTGDEPVTGPQASYLDTLAREAGETVPENLTKAQASELIDRLQNQTGRGAS